MIDFEKLQNSMSDKIPPLPDDRFVVQLSRESAIENGIDTTPQQIPSKLFGKGLTSMASSGVLIYAGVQHDFHVFIVV